MPSGRRLAAAAIVCTAFACAPTPTPGSPTLANRAAERTPVFVRTAGGSTGLNHFSVLVTNERIAFFENAATEPGPSGILRRGYVVRIEFSQPSTPPTQEIEPSKTKTIESDSNRVKLERGGQTLILGVAPSEPELSIGYSLARRCHEGEPDEVWGELLVSSADGGEWLLAPPRDGETLTIEVIGPGPIEVPTDESATTLILERYMRAQECAERRRALEVEAP